MQNGDKSIKDIFYKIFKKGIIIKAKILLWETPSISKHFNLDFCFFVTVIEIYINVKK